MCFNIENKMPKFILQVDLSEHKVEQGKMWQKRKNEGRSSGDSAMQKGPCIAGGAPVMEGNSAMKAGPYHAAVTMQWRGGFTIQEWFCKASGFSSFQ